MSRQFTIWNGASPTTAAIVPVTTGTAVKTMLQLAPPATVEAEIVAWGIMLDSATFGVKAKVELIETDVAATVTAHVAAGLVKVTDPGGLASQLTLGTAATGYTATAEGTTTASRLIDYQQVDISGAYSFVWPLGNYPVLQAGKFLRVRVTSPTAANAITFVTIQE
jgi:hypothetical protein